MNLELQSFLDTAGATSGADGATAHFGAPAEELRAARDGSIVCPLDGFGLIAAAGADAASFLQGQLTCDMRLVDEARSLPGGYCTPKGRLLALPWILRRDDRYLLQLPASLLASTLTRLSRYVLRAQVTLEVAPLAMLGLSGPEAPAILEAAGIPFAAGTGGVSHHGEHTVVRIPGPQPRFMLLAPAAALIALWPRLTAGARPAGAPAWDLLDVLTGLPRVLPETLEEFIPQALNLDLLGGIAFDKGCYTGQEIVARVHYRGTVKRRCYLAAGPGEPPAPGTPVHGPESADQAAGHVVLAAPDPDGGFLCLASLSQTQAAAGGLHLDADRALTLRELPYLAAAEG
ncbi:MAG: folate-binding protein [Gammaproteobacteria bacterium]|jgi:folate-binding protein YgfZ|nr:folate-binding protein [Gammaproteobacteria bacterium]